MRFRFSPGTGTGVDPAGSCLRKQSPPVRGLRQCAPANVERDGRPATCQWRIRFPMEGGCYKKSFFLHNMNRKASQFNSFNNFTLSIETNVNARYTNIVFIDFITRIKFNNTVYILQIISNFFYLQRIFGGNPV